MWYKRFGGQGIPFCGVEFVIQFTDRFGELRKGCERCGYKMNALGGGSGYCTFRK